jgi:hypothetical protein
VAGGTSFVSSSDAVVRTIAVLICVGGCSFGLSGPDPNRPATTAPTCDTSKGLVTVDALTAVATGVIGLASLSGHENGVGGVMLLTSAVYGAAAVHGTGAVDRCRAAFREYEVAMTNLASERGPAIAAKPQDPYDAPAVAARPPPIPKPVAQPKAEPVATPAETAAKIEAVAKPAEPEPAPKLDEADAFHVPVGGPEPGRPAKLKPRPAKPASNDVWRDFWRGVP